MNKDKFMGRAVLFYAKKNIDYSVINKALKKIGPIICAT